MPFNIYAVCTIEVLYTPAEAKIICGKNVRAQVSTIFTSNEWCNPRKEKQKREPFGISLLNSTVMSAQFFCSDLGYPKLAWFYQKKRMSFLKENFDIENWLWKYDFSTFWRTVISRRIKKKKNSLSMLILGLKSCILGPTIFKIPQPNWQYCL